MIENQTTRTAMLIGEDGIEKLRDARVILFGVGGVGSFTCEALIRAGVGHLTLVDKDSVDITNVNRQLIATHKTIGEVKVEVAAARCREINPQADILPLHQCFLPENAEDFHLEAYDYVIDAIDMVTAKLGLAESCSHLGVKLISSMGTGNKLDPTRFEIADITKTSVCPLAKVMRRELKNRGIRHLKVLYSKEVPLKKCTPPGSISFVPSVAGLIIAGEVIRELIGE